MSLQVAEKQGNPNAGDRVYRPYQGIGFRIQGLPERPKYPSIEPLWSVIVGIKVY